MPYLQDKADGTSEEVEIKYKDKRMYIEVSEKNNRVNLKELVKILGQEGIDSILIEGGGTLNFSALEENIVDKAIFYIAPKIF